MTPITRTEREDLQRLIRQREKVLKSAAKQRSAELIADFENQMGQEYSFDQDATWQQANEAAEREVAKRSASSPAVRNLASRKTSRRPYEWFGTTAGKMQRSSAASSLRRMALTQIEALERKAVTKSSLSCLQAQTEFAVAGLTSDAARQFIEKLPSVDGLMPRLSFAEVAGEAEPPIAEQLVSPNALRQRRYRQRQAALQGASRNARVTSRNASDCGGEKP